MFKGIDIILKLFMSANPKFCFHVLSLPHTVTTPEYNACAYTMKVLKFCKMMKARGHKVIHYGHRDSVVECDEHVTLLDNDDLLKAYGSYNWKKDFFRHNVNDHCNVKFQELGTKEVLKRLGKTRKTDLSEPDGSKEPSGSRIQDFVLAFWGIGHKKICDAAKATGMAIICEPGIGYSGSFMDFRVFESYAWMHMTYGDQKISKPSWYHTVIPNYFDPSEFKFSPLKSDYFLCLGRISTCKGLHIVVQAALKYKFKLVIAGQGNLKDVGCPDPLPENIIYYGYADVEARKNLMAYAKGFIILSDYAEPFGGAAVEALMSGTPVISTDWGVFNETIQHNLTGYRVRTFEHLTYALKNIDKINPYVCRQWAMDNYSLEKVSKMYEEYFSQLDNLNRGGWYEPFDERKELSWLERSYPRIDDFEKSFAPKVLDSSETVSHLACIKALEAKFKERSSQGNEVSKERSSQGNIKNAQANANILKQIFIKYNTDKYNAKPHSHTYHNCYGELLEGLKEKPIKLFEMGIGTVRPDIESSMIGYQKLFNYKPGASHRAWSEYFSHHDSKIYGGDIDETICGPENFEGFPKIKCAQVDQTKKEAVEKVFKEFCKESDSNKQNSQEDSSLFDIIIDDGLHTQEAAINMLKGSWNYLKVGGIYCIEDVNFDYKKYIKPKFHKFVKIWNEPKEHGVIEDNYISIIYKTSEESFLLEEAEVSKKTESLRSIAFWIENNWAMGRIHNDLIKYLSKFSNYKFTIFDWNKSEDTVKLLETWKDYDIIFSNTALFNSRYKFFEELYKNPEFLNKCFSVAHTPFINHPYFNENIDNLDSKQIANINFGHVSRKGLELWKNHYKFNDSKTYYLPCGVDLDNFKFREFLREIKNIGIIGKPEYPEVVEKVKRISLFKTIVDATGLNPVFIHSKPFSENSKLYENIDLLICTSTDEAGPLGILEAAAMGIPVLSTKVGNLVELESIKFFETAEEAASLIKDFLANPNTLINYVNAVTKEVREKFNWEVLVEKYWSKIL